MTNLHSETSNLSLDASISRFVVATVVFTVTWAFTISALWTIHLAIANHDYDEGTAYRFLVPPLALLGVGIVLGLIFTTVGIAWVRAGLRPSVIRRRLCVRAALVTGVMLWSMFALTWEGVFPALYGAIAGIAGIYASHLSLIAWPAHKVERAKTGLAVVQQQSSKFQWKANSFRGEIEFENLRRHLPECVGRERSAALLYFSVFARNPELELPGGRRCPGLAWPQDEPVCTEKPFRPKGNERCIRFHRSPQRLAQRDIVRRYHFDRGALRGLLVDAKPRVRQ